MILIHHSLITRWLFGRGSRDYACRLNLPSQFQILRARYKNVRSVRLSKFGLVKMFGCSAVRRVNILSCQATVQHLLKVVTFFRWRFPRQGTRYTTSRLHEINLNFIAWDFCLTHSYSQNANFQSQNDSNSSESKPSERVSAVPSANNNANDRQI